MAEQPIERQVDKLLGALGDYNPDEDEPSHDRRRSVLLGRELDRTLRRAAVDFEVTLTALLRAAVELGWQHHRDEVLRRARRYSSRRP